jgi:hypothetical protein
LSSGHQRPDEVITLTDEDLAGACHVVSCLIIREVFRQDGTDKHKYDGYSIGLRANLIDVERGYPKAFLFDEDASSAVLIKDLKMSGIWAHGKRASTAPGTDEDVNMDRASILVEGKVPPHYILIRFPSGTRLKNVFTPYQSGCRQIKKAAILSQLDGEVSESTTVLGRWPDPSAGHVMVEVRLRERTEQLQAYVQAMFCVAKGEPLTRFSKHADGDDDAQMVRDLFGQLKPPSAGAPPGGTPTPPTTGSSR